MCELNDTLACAKELDRADVLRKFRDRFYIPENTIYMDGNSCGLCSKNAEAYVYEVVECWKRYGIDIWSAPEANYFLYQDKLGEMMAPLIHARPEEVTVCASTTMNIHQAIATFYHPTAQKYKILMDALNFPTDRYAVHSQIRLHGLDPEQCLKIVESQDGKYIDEADVLAAMTDDVCLTLLPAVLYRSAQLLDMERLTEAAHARGILIGWDLCHSIGVVPHNFEALQPDFAVWCNYKYLNGGPGAIAGLYINHRHFAAQPGLAGWHGNRKETQFELNQTFEHAHYAGGWQTGTQPLLSMAPIQGSLEIFAEAGMEAIRAKSLKLTEYLMFLVDTKLSRFGFAVGSPRDALSRGGHIAVEHADAVRISAAMKKDGIIPDFRYPNVIRLAPAPLYTSFEDVYEMVERMIAIMREKKYEHCPGKPKTVA